MRAHLPPNPAGIRVLHDTEAQRLREQDPSLPRIGVRDDPAACPTCRGQREFQWWSYAAVEPEIALQQPHEIVTFECPCQEQWVLHRYLLHSGIGTAYQRLGWSDATAVETDAIAAIDRYLQHSEAYVDSGCGLILYGDVGNGKTLLAVLLLKSLLGQGGPEGKGYDGCFTTFSELLEIFINSWRDSKEKDWFYRRIKQAGVLVIDDVGREYRKSRLVEGKTVEYGSGFPERTLEEIIRHRIGYAKPTIVTTNLNPTGLLKGYGANVISLLSERSTLYHMKAPDFRIEARQRLEEEIVQGLTRPLVVV